MSRVRNPQQTRAILLAAAARVLERHYLTADRNRLVLPISVTDVINETAHSSNGAPVRTVSQGSIKSSFGSKADFLRAAAVHFLRTPRAHSAPPTSEIMPTTAGLTEFCIETVRDRLANLAMTRHWHLLHAHAADDSMAEEIFQEFFSIEARLAEVCQLAATADTRRPIPGEDWNSVSTALTAWIEGVVLRLGWTRSQTSPAESVDLNEQEQLLIRQGVQMLWNGLTYASNQTGQDRSVLGRPVELTLKLDYLDVEWFNFNKAAVRGSLKPTSTTISVPWLQDHNLGGELRLRARIDYESDNIGRATVALLLSDETDSSHRPLRASIISADGSTRSEIIRQGFVEIENVLVTSVSPADLELKLELI